MNRQFSSDFESYSPVRPKLFCEQKNIVIRLEQSSVYTGLITVTNLGVGQLEWYMFANFDGITFEQLFYKSNGIDVKYTINASKIKNQQSDKKIIIKSNGGEEVIKCIIDMIVTIERDSEIQTTNKSDPFPFLYEPIVNESPRKLVRIDLSKKSFYLSETPKIQVKNFLSDPIQVTVFTKCKWLLTPEPVFVEREADIMLGIQLTKTFKWAHKWIGREPFLQDEVQVLIENEHYQRTMSFSVVIDLLNEEHDSHKKIKNEADYKKESIKIHRNILEAVILEKKEMFEAALKETKRSIDFHPNDIYMRLLYIYLQIQVNSMVTAKKDLQYFIKYQHFFKEQINIGIIVRWLNHLVDTNVPFVLGEFDSSDRFEWIIQLLKFKNSSEMDFDHLAEKYRLGDRNPYLFLFGFKYCRLKQLIPSKNDLFFAHLLKWAVRHNLLDDQYLITIDHYILILYQTKNIDLSTIDSIYLKYETPNILKIYVLLLMENQRFDNKAFQRYLDAKKAHLIIKKLDEYLIKSAIINRIDDLKTEVVRHISIKELDDECMSYVFFQYERNRDELERHYALMSGQLIERMNTIILSGQVSSYLYRGLKYHLKNLYGKKIDAAKILFFETIYRNYPDIEGIDFAIIEIIRYYKNSEDFDHLLNIFSFDMFVRYKLQDEVILYLIHNNSISKATEMLNIIGIDKITDRTREKYYYAVIKENAINDFKFFEKYILETEMDSTVSDYYFLTSVFSFEEMIRLFNHYFNSELDLSGLAHRILDEAIYLNIFNTDLQTVFIRYAKGSQIDQELLKRAEQFLLYQIVINDAFILPECVDIIIGLNDQEEITLPLAITFLKSHSQGLIQLDQNYIEKLVAFILAKEVIFPWLVDLVDDPVLTKRIRERKYFEYHCISQKRVYLHYRYDCEKHFMIKELSSIGFGMFITSITTFFSEIIEYYFVEKDEHQSELITLSDIYTHNILSDNSDRADFFDLINTALMSRFYDDQQGLEEVVAQHISNQKIVQNKFKVI